MKFFNGLLYEVHRWLGIVLAVFMLVWFATGLVIMYATPMTQSRTQQLAHAETLGPEAGWLSLGEVWQRSADDRQAHSGLEAAAKSGGANIAIAIADARLARVDGQPLWLIEDTRGQRYALSALDASLVNFDAARALRIAGRWYKTETGHDAARVEFVETLENPVILRNLDAFKPFHHVAVGDDGLELLISARTGEVLHASTVGDRVFYYAGNWLHLFKPLESLGWGSIRHDVQLWSGVGAMIASLTGLIIGWLRWRPGFGGKKTYSQGRTQPYREPWMVWHFWSGLIGGTLALFWAVSGYVSTNPGKWFSSPELSKAEASRYLGNETPAAIQDWIPSRLADASAGDVVELGWRRLGGETVLLAYGRDGRRVPQVLAGTARHFSKAAIVDAVQRVMVEAPLADSEVMTEYDSYYYPRHHQGLIDKPLPVVKLQFADQAGTRLYIDPQDGRVLAKLDQSRRVYRWLYSALHHWDFGWLQVRPIWDIWMLIWVGFGLVLAASSAVIGWRRLKKTVTPKKSRVPAATPVNGNLVTEAGR